MTIKSLILLLETIADYIESSAKGAKEAVAYIRKKAKSLK